MHRSQFPRYPLPEPIKPPMIRRSRVLLLAVCSFAPDLSTLASPRYREKWGRHWLDVTRFGESNGFERNVVINTILS